VLRNALLFFKSDHFRQINLQNVIASAHNEQPIQNQGEQLYQMTLWSNVS